MSESPETEPTRVPARAKQAGEADACLTARWSWVEPTIWTPRMLTALEQGVKGGKWFSLIDKVHHPATLDAAFGKVAANKGAAGVDHVTIEEFASRSEARLTRLAEQLRAGTYQPQAIRRILIPKPGSQEKRPLGIPTVRDRIVQAALRGALEPIFERDFAEHSYGFRPGRGALDAVRRVEELLAQGYTCVVDADLKSYFDTIPHAPLMTLIEEKVSDGRVLSLIRAFLKQSVKSEQGLELPESGTPQGAVLSPLLSNIYLDPLDQLMVRQGREMVRYADDFVILCRSEAEAQAALTEVARWTTSVGLTLHPDKTRIVDATQPGGFDFLGYHFERGRKWPRRRSLQKLRDQIREQTARTSGESLDQIIRRVNLTLCGWSGYFQDSCRTTFPRIDQWVRMRLRSVLRKRAGGQGRGTGQDHFRWPNAFFETRGLFNLSVAHASSRSVLSR